MLELLLAGLLVSDPSEDIGEEPAAQVEVGTLGERFPLEVSEDEAKSYRAKLLLRMALKTWDKAEDVAYKHSTRINRSAGRYHFDCSGMMNWMLKHTAPQARESLGRERPVARTYAHTIGNAPFDRARGGWRQLRIHELAPGDIFAWERPPNWPKGGNTGHVGIVMGEAQPVHDWTNAYTVRVMDASRYYHQDDTRDGSDSDGLGVGTLLFVADGDGAATHYGWFGSESESVHATTIVFGRVIR